MKKITLLLTMFVAFASFAQINTSFEASEGFALGPIAGQNSWARSSTSVDGNFLVSDIRATEGTFSLRATSVGAPALLFAFAPAVALTQTTATVVSKVYIPTGNSEAVLQTQTAALIGNRLIFAANNTISVTDYDGTGTLVIAPTGATYLRDTNIVVRQDFDFTNNTVEYFINGTSIFTAAYNAAGAPFVRVLLGFTNNGSDVFYDEVMVTDGTLSVNESNLIAGIRVYPNPAIDVLKVKIPASVEILTANVYDVIGRSTAVKIENNEINVSSLTKGVYVLSLETSAGSFTQKIIKQ